MSELPDPLVPAEVDLRDFGFMPLDVRRLLTSETWIEAADDPKVGHAVMCLWCESWHQVPAASLPDNDKVLARLSMCDARAWARIKDKVLSGWVKCSDGLLYHPTVAEKAVDSWKAKLAQRARTKAATEAREAKRRAEQEARDSQRNDSRDDQRDVARDVHQGTGTVKGQGQGLKKTVVAADASTAPPAPPVTLAGLVAEGVHRQHAADWLALRKAKRLPLTATAWDDTKAEGVKAGLTPAQTVAKAVANNWAGFKASWQAEGGAKTAPQQSADIFASAK